MITDIIEYQPAPLPALLPAPEVQDRLADLWANRKAKNTRRAYASDWRQFEIWAFAAGHETMPATPQTIAQYLDHLVEAGKACSTIGRRLAALSHQHNERGAVDPTKDRVVVGLMEGIRRKLAGRPTAAKAAIRTRHLRKGLRAAPVKHADYRNRALLLLGFAGGFRRSELVGIDVEHLTFSDEGAVRVMLPKSKTNQHGEPESVWILPGGAYCPVKALRAWLEVAGITAGPVFRSIDRHRNVKGRISSDLVPYIVKRFCKSVGLDPKQFSAHSLRAGLVTEGFACEVPLELIQAQTRHRTVDVLLKYRRETEGQKRNVSDRLGL